MIDASRNIKPYSLLISAWAMIVPFRMSKTTLDKETMCETMRAPMVSAGKNIG